MNITPFTSLASRHSFPLSLAAGLLTVPAFAPFGWWPLQILTLALLFWLILRQSSVARSALLGWTFGFGWAVWGVYWLFVSMHRHGGMPAWMAALAVAAMALVLGAFAAFAAGGAAWLRRRWTLSPTVTALLVLPAMWALSEWMRGWVLTGLPWLAFGYAHTASPLAGFAPVAGVYGIGALAALVAGCVALLPATRLPMLLAAATMGTGVLLQSVTWTQPHGAPISVRLLQGNVPQEMKFALETQQATLALYHDMIAAAPADLIATPETAIPMFAHQLPPDYLDLLSGYARRTGSHLALGIPVSDGPQHYANSVLSVSPAAGRNSFYRYDKHHLVPFGEFVPWGFRWFVAMMNIPLGDFGRGDVLQAPFAVKDQLVMPNICYEDLFGEEIAAQLRAGRASGKTEATILLNVSNIAWFGDTIALPQHLQISRMRALETGRPMLRATNTGVTAVIDAQGKAVARLPAFQRGALAASVQGRRGATPYILFGNSLVVGLAGLMLASAWLAGRKNRGSK